MISKAAPPGHVVCILTRVMLPPYIIEELRRRERAKKSRDRDEQPRLQLPLPPKSPAPTSEEPAERGVAIIEVF